jgi:hypothetical protein
MAAPGAGFDLIPNPLVSRLGGPMPAPGVQTVPVARLAWVAPRALAGPNSPDRRSFEGYLGETFLRSRGRRWTQLYLDWDLETWLIIETSGIVGRERIPSAAGSGAPTQRDVVLVLADAAVGHGRRSLSIEGAFLCGNFTRAGDFEASPNGGTLAASTGVFCEARSPSCCQVCTNRTPRR